MCVCTMYLRLAYASGMYILWLGFFLGGKCVHGCVSVSESRNNFRISFHTEQQFTFRCVGY